jgi:Flp pilus assembly protein TadG
VSDIRDSAPSARPRRRLRRGDESGAALVEFALVVGLFMFVLYGLISFGMILAQKQRITNAAAEAARSAVGESSDANAITVATNRVTKLLGAPGSYKIGPDPAGKPTVTACTPPSVGSCITVTITYDYKNHPIVPPAPGLGLVTPNTFSSTAVVQYK